MRHRRPADRSICLFRILMLWLSMIAAVGLASPGYVATFHVKHLMDATPRSVVMPAVELIVHRAARR
jgi:hypothetical protein